MSFYKNYNPNYENKYLNNINYGLKLNVKINDI
jgi:hypothetical protein